MTRRVYAALVDAVRSDGARLMVVNVHYGGERAAMRQRALSDLGAEWVDIAAFDRPELHYRYDSHWNAAGHAQAGSRIADAIRSRGLLPSGQRVEVVNASMRAFSTCKELHVYRAIARRYEPDLVVALHTASDERNLADEDICRSDGSGRLVLGERRFGALDTFLRDILGWIRSRSHFLTWTMDRALALPAFEELRRQRIPVTDPGAP